MNPIISELNIERYRGIKDLELTDLSTINVLAGVNNSGKTSVLEAIGMLSNPVDPGTVIQWLLRRAPKDKSQRKKNQIAYTSSAFNKGDLPNPLGISIKSTIYNTERFYYLGGVISNIITSSGEVRRTFLFNTTLIPFALKDINQYLLSFQEIFPKKLRKSLEKALDSLENDEEVVITEKSEDTIRVESLAVRDGVSKSYNQKYSPLFPVAGIFTEEDYYQNCVRWIHNAITNEEKKPEILRVLSQFDASIDDVSIVNEDIYLHSSYAGTQPLFSYGTGVQKAVLLISILLSSANGVVLVDEIDNALNISAFSDVFTWFIRMCRELNIQAFITTHSMEAIDAILEATEDDVENGLEDDIRIITLRKTPKTHRSVALVRTGEEARSDRDRFEMEMRV